MKNKLSTLFKKMEHWHVIAILLAVYDVMAISASYFVGLWMRFDFVFSRINPVYLDAYRKFLPIYILFSLVGFYCGSTTVSGGLPATTN